MVAFAVFLNEYLSADNECVLFCVRRWSVREEEELYDMIYLTAIG
jgi:hypothetical protein